MITFPSHSGASWSDAPDRDTPELVLVLAEFGLVRLCAASDPNGVGRDLAHGVVSCLPRLEKAGWRKGLGGSPTDGAAWPVVGAFGLPASCPEIADGAAWRRSGGVGLHRCRSIVGRVRPSSDRISRSRSSHLQRPGPARMPTDRVRHAVRAWLFGVPGDRPFVPHPSTSATVPAITGPDYRSVVRPCAQRHCREEGWDDEAIGHDRRGLHRSLPGRAGRGRATSCTSLRQRAVRGPTFPGPSAL